ncbi:uncharacterized protein LOC117322944 [Pecten maximus]|uniref:uncharacterized protein LOC117322944 n=1 Tax=Pecten maximus TaxID=6579 RepID=UPI001458B4ED|nr:uncharacterized protein LOC117322944 [Pecten maximus]
MDRHGTEKSSAGSNAISIPSGKGSELIDPTGKPSSPRKPTGAVESGVLIRKTSIRRRLSTETGDGVNDVTSYGKQTKEYSRLRKEIMASPGVKNALESLHERWKMLMFMYEDCLDMIQERKDRHKQTQRCRERREIFATSIIYTGIFMPVAVLTLVFLLTLF